MRMEIRWWKTEDEIRYLDGIGTYCAVKGRKTEPKIKFLLRYRKAIESRVYWDHIDAAKVRAYVDDLIAREV
jgi:hypothetical protein